FLPVQLPPVPVLALQGYQEQGILFGYRPPRSSAADCLLSVFQMTNETLNIWTHFVPAWYFVWTLVGRLQGPGGPEDPNAWPLLAYLLTCCIYPLASSCAHTFSTMSTHARHICYFFDYAALSMYSLGKAHGAISCPASPPQHPQVLLRRAALDLLLCRAGPCEIPSLFSCRFLEVERPMLSKASRTLAFVYPYLFDSIPLFYRFYRCAAEGCTEAAIPVHYKHTGFAFLTCFIFASHLPERLAPGHFDYIGHSHQVFHVCGIIGTLFQMEAITMDMAERHDRLLPPSLLPSSPQTLGSMGIGVAASLAVIGLCSLSLRFMPEPLQR
ncbi:MPRGB protein, partial [Halcyon senegalensis]|nr:MPRGB protein [Halcyon senegalensis]